MSAGAETQGKYALYGAYASLYTGKARSYLRKKGISFIERMPAHPRFREHVSVIAESKRIPILETPDGQIIQDTTAIFDHVEAVHPTPPALPPGPKQRLAAHLIEYFASENLVRVAWHFRWSFLEENLHFVKREFGRSFKPQGSDAELDHYGNIIVSRMHGYRKATGITPEMYGTLQDIYFDVLDALEEHFTAHPFLFGGLPSIADFSLMGPLFAHLGRDPYPLHLMQRRTPRVFRWVEHMSTPEIQSPEFADTPMEYLAGDEVPETILRLLRQLCGDYNVQILANAHLYNDWVAANPGLAPGALVSSEGLDQPSLGDIAVDLRGHRLVMASQIHGLWIFQRALNWYRGLDPAARAACDALAVSVGAAPLLAIELARPLTRVRNRLAVA